MHKFIIILKKELRDSITIQTIVPIIIMGMLFMLLGNFMNGVFDDKSSIEVISDDKQNGQYTVYTTDKFVGIINRDVSEVTELICLTINRNGYNIKNLDVNSAEEAFSTEPYMKDLIIIPENFSENFNTGLNGSATLEIYSTVSSYSIFSMINKSSVSSIINSLNQNISYSLLEKNTDGSMPLAFMLNPINADQYTHTDNGIEQIAPETVIGFVTSQITFIPIIIFLIITFSTQTIASSVTGEKSDKTLETLLTTPVSRLSILVAKMLSASVISVVYAVIFMTGYNSYMKSVTGDSMSNMGGLTDTLAALGISFSFETYLIVGIQLFLSILIGLSLAIIIGIIAEDIKKLQGLIMPLIVLLLVPYLLSMFIDINTLPIVFRYIIYMIPFTHTFTAMTNIFAGNIGLLIGGMIYQFIFLLLSIGCAVWIFETDLIFTLKLNIGFKARTKKVK